MYQVELIREDQHARPQVVEFYTVPIGGPDDYRCPEETLSFDQAKQISFHLAIGDETGEIDQWKWRVGEFPVCPFCDLPVAEGIPLCPRCESISGEAACQPPSDKVRQLDVYTSHGHI